MHAPALLSCCGRPLCSAAGSGPRGNGRGRLPGTCSPIGAGHAGACTDMQGRDAFLSFTPNACSSRQHMHKQAGGAHCMESPMTEGAGQGRKWSSSSRACMLFRGHLCGRVKGGDDIIAPQQQQRQREAGHVQRRHEGACVGAPHVHLRMHDSCLVCTHGPAHQ